MTSIRGALTRAAAAWALTLALAGMGPGALSATPAEPSACVSCHEGYDERPGLAHRLAPAEADTFSHPIHKKIACLTCHLSKTGAKLTFEPPRGCQICHHEERRRDPCSACHAEEELGDALEAQVAVTVPDHDTRTRTVGFRHELHDSKECRDCHTARVTNAPADSVKTCAGCHADHHAAERNCATCHRTDAITEPHEEFEVAHYACYECHTEARIAVLEPRRSFCLACHDPEQDHYKERECAKCHFLMTPDAFKSKLRQQPRRTR